MLQTLNNLVFVYSSCILVIIVYSCRNEGVVASLQAFHPIDVLSFHLLDLLRIVPQLSCFFFLPLSNRSCYSSAKESDMKKYFGWCSYYSALYFKLKYY